MYGIPANTPCKIIRPGAEWHPENIKDHVTREFRVFDTSECIVDPTGVHAFAISGRSTLPVIGADWARAGWFGFRDEATGWTMLVEPAHVEYDGTPLLQPTGPVTVDRPSVGETAGLVDGAAYHAARAGAQSVDWATPGLRVTRLRLLSDRGFSAWDVSYCHGTLDGEPVDVELPFSQLQKYGRTISSQIVTAAIECGVHAKRLGILDAISKLN